MKYRCFSFASTVKIPGFPYHLPHIEGSVQACIKNGIGIMMDSGVVGFRTYKTSLKKAGKDLSKIPTDLEFTKLYVSYIKATQQHWDFFMGCDHLQEAESIYQNHLFVESLGIRPVPVFHGDKAASDYVRRYADLGYDFLAISSWKTIRTGQKKFRQYLDEVFNICSRLKMRVHGLAMTASYMMCEYPFFSVDSSSWSRAAGYGTIFRFDEDARRMSSFHISDRATKGKGADAKHNIAFMQRVKEDVESCGYSFDVMRQAEGEEAFVLRHIWNAQQMEKLAQYATKIHASGGLGSWEPLI
jgi:hypothetical protein